MCSWRIERWRPPPIAGVELVQLRAIAGVELVQLRVELGRVAQLAVVEALSAGPCARSPAPCSCSCASSSWPRGASSSATWRSSPAWRPRAIAGAELVQLRVELGRLAQLAGVEALSVRLAGAGVLAELAAPPRSSRPSPHTPRIRPNPLRRGPFYCPAHGVYWPVRCSSHLSVPHAQRPPARSGADARACGAAA